VCCKHLYRRVKGDVAEGSYETPFSARIAREGTDLTVIAYGATLHLALTAADGLADEGIDCEVVDLRVLCPLDFDTVAASVEVLDLRSLVPLDEEAVLASVRKTSKVLIVDEANQTCAAGAQVAAVIAEKGFEDLDGPVRRVATPDVPIPFSPPLEQALLPSVDRVKEAARELLEY